MSEDKSPNSDVEKIQQFYHSQKKDLKWFFIFVVFLLIIRSVVFEPYRIPSSSMMPTLVNGDFILVDKMAYGFKLPFSDLVFKLPFGEHKVNLDPIYLYKRKLPERGDVVVFKYPVSPEINYIKRVIAIPGDEIEIKQKNVFLNGKKLNSTYIDNLELRRSFEKIFKDYNFDMYLSVTKGGQYIYQINRGNFYNQNYKKIKIPEGKYFVMGDNRDFSYDSRAWGFVDFEQIKGKALVVWFSLTLPSVESSLSFNPFRIGIKI